MMRTSKVEQPQRSIWFPAKRYGWGWGFPIAWQGWIVLLGYGACLAAGVSLLTLRQKFVSAGVLALLLSLLLVGVCYMKGEKPRWRWGG